MRITFAAVASVLLVAPAVAQIGGINLLDDNKRLKTQEEVDGEKAVNDAYKSALKKVPDQKRATNDPWADVRGANEPKTQKQGRSSPNSKAN
jgi:hypothetical protein